MVVSYIPFIVMVPPLFRLYITVS